MVWQISRGGTIETPDRNSPILQAYSSGLLYVPLVFRSWASATCPRALGPFYQMPMSGLLPVTTLATTDIKGVLAYDYTLCSASLCRQTITAATQADHS